MGEVRVNEIITTTTSVCRVVLLGEVVVNSPLRVQGLEEQSWTIINEYTNRTLRARYSSSNLVLPTLTKQLSSPTSQDCTAPGCSFHLKSTFLTLWPFSPCRLDDPTTCLHPRFQIRNILSPSCLKGLAIWPYHFIWYRLANMKNEHWSYHTVLWNSQNILLAAILCTVTVMPYQVW